jgi:Na+/H+-dicarboxylate symporter
LEFLKSITGKIVTGLVALGVIAGAITFWRMDPASRQALLNNTGKILLWLGVVLAWPWVSFAIIARVARLESNAAGGVLVAAYTLLELALLAWLFHWHVAGASRWTFFLLGGLIAGVYNLLVCDWIAEKLE